MMVVCPQPCFAVAAAPAGCSAGCAADAKARGTTACRDQASDQFRDGLHTHHAMRHHRKVAHQPGEVRRKRSPRGLEQACEPGSKHA